MIDMIPCIGEPAKEEVIERVPEKKNNLPDHAAREISVQ